MKVITIVKLSKNTLEMLSKFGIKTNDFKYTQLYDDFHILRDLRGEKYEIAVTELSEKYDISRSKVIRLINKYNQQVD